MSGENRRLDGGVLPLMLRSRPFPLALSLLAAATALVVAACGGQEGSPAADAPPETDTGLDVGFDLGDDVVEADLAEPEPTPFGAPCTSDGDCGSRGSCLDEAAFRDGYCAELDCASNLDCGAAGVCVTGASGTFCAERCLGESQCRNGYGCFNQAGTALSACLPLGGGNSDGAADGEACASHADCRGGTCITSEGWPAGYCTTTFCDNFEDCASNGQDNRCLIQRGGTNFCVRICTSQAECRDGYVCQGIGGGLGYCGPNPFEPIDVVPEDYPFDITCQPVLDNGVLRLEYDIAEDTTAYMVTPYASDGFWINPLRVDLPSGGRVDFAGMNDFQLAGAQLLGWTNPTVVPATAQLAAQLEAGRHTFVLETGASEICHYVLEESTPGTTIDFNIYLVRVPGMTAANAPDDPNMSAVLATFDAIFAAADVQIGQVRFFDVTGADADRYGVLRSDADLNGLVALTTRPGDTVDDVLSANVFFLRSITMGGAIGIASALPGPAGLHGTSGSGVVFTSQFLGQQFQEDGRTVDGNAYTGVVFAHEVGHYLGLFHTSEQFGFGYDPLPDTPRCSGRDFPDRCEDLTNFMFPFAGIDHTEVTPDQVWVLQVNPLTKD
jgi:hypothetical protein